MVKGKLIFYVEIYQETLSVRIGLSKKKLFRNILVESLYLGYHFVDLVEINPNIYTMLVFDRVKTTKINQNDQFNKNEKNGKDPIFQRFIRLKSIYIKT